MAYAILRFAKRKGGAAKAIAAHNERTKEAYASNPDIDKSRTVQNEHLIAPRWSYGQEIRHRIGMAGCRVRRDSVKFVETLITTSPEFAKAHESEMPEYFERALGFLKERVGEENIFSAVVHMDEKTPHMHLCFVPLTKDKRLSAKEILGNKKAMIRWQDDFYACMSERWPELERGTPAVETKRRHLTPQWYKRVTAMDTKLEKLETALNGINVLNAGKKREEAVALLAQLLPEVESFQAEIQRMQQAVSRSLTMQRCSAEENETLKDELTAERRKSAEQRAKLTVLEERYKRAEKLLKRLPLELTERVEDKEKSQER
ncbi:MAG TPA: plasmid recombination protein [Clostridiales bacterium]|jgi:Plasmid recombination enzyme.|nr:plasmid recombination protein [Clostridiales bacterium]